MSQQIANIGLAGAIVGTTGNIDFQQSIPPPTIESQMSAQRTSGSTLVIYNESACGLRCTFPTSGETFTVPAGAWKKIAVHPNETQLDYEVIYLLSGALVNSLLADLYMPGEAVDEIGNLGNSPIGVNTVIANQLGTVSDGLTTTLSAISTTDYESLYPYASPSADRGIRIQTLDSGGGLTDVIQIDPLGTNMFIKSNAFMVDHTTTLDALAANGGALITDGAGRLSTISGHATAAASTGAPAISGHTAGTHITATTDTIIATHTPGSIGLYLVAMRFLLNNGTSGQLIKAYVKFNSGNSGSSITNYFQLIGNAATAYLTAAGVSSFTNSEYGGAELLILANTTAAIELHYQDPANTPNDFVSGSITRLTL